MRKFFSAVWGESEGVAEIRLIHQGPGRPAQHFFDWPRQADEVASFCSSKSGESHVYFGVCLRGEKAGGEKAARWSNAVWADIDFKDYKGGEGEARKKIKDFPLKVSLAVHSGNGFHLYWVMREPWDLSVDEERRKLKAINRAVAKAVGGDHVHDLARVLRVPGTLNVKVAPYVPCRVLVSRDDRYNPADFEGHLKIDDSPPPPQQPIQTGMLTLPKEIRDKVVDVARKIWVNGARHNVALYLSGYLAKKGVSQVDVEQLIHGICYIAGDDDVSDRLHAVKETFDAVRSGKTVAGYKGLEEVVQRLPEEAQKALESLDRLFPSSSPAGAISIRSVRKINSRPARYHVEIMNGEAGPMMVSVETADLLNYQTFRKVAFEELDLLLPQLKAKSWDARIKEAMKSLVIEEAPEETREHGELSDAIEAFVVCAMEAPDGKKAFVIENKALLSDDGKVMLRWDVLKKFLVGRGVSADSRDTWSVLRKLGWESKTVRIDGVPTRLWVGGTQKTI